MCLQLFIFHTIRCIYFHQKNNKIYILRNVPVLTNTYKRVLSPVMCLQYNNVSVNKTIYSVLTMPTAQHVKRTTLATKQSLMKGKFKRKRSFTLTIELCAEFHVNAISSTYQQRKRNPHCLNILYYALYQWLFSSYLNLF